MGAWEIQCSDEEKADIRSLRCLMKIECCVIPFLRGHTEVSNVYRIVDFLYPRFSVPCCHLESILRRQWLRRYQARSRQLVQRDSVARDIDPEIFALTQALIHFIERMDDDVDRPTYIVIVQDLVLGDIPIEIGRAHV